MPAKRMTDPEIMLIKIGLVIFLLVFSVSGVWGISSSMPSSVPAIPSISSSSSIFTFNPKVLSIVCCWPSSSSKVTTITPLILLSTFGFCEASWAEFGSSLAATFNFVAGKVVIVKVGEVTLPEVIVPISLT